MTDRDFTTRGFRSWVIWCAFIGSAAFGVIVGAIVVYFTLKLNPHLAASLSDSVLLFLSITLFYGIVGALAGAAAGFIGWILSVRTDSRRVHRFLEGAAVTFLFLAPVSWALSTTPVSLTLYSLKGRLLLSPVGTSFLGIAFVLILLLAAGYVLAGPLSKITKPFRVLIVIYGIVFIALLILTRGTGPSKNRSERSDSPVDYSMENSGISFIIIGLDCLDWDMLTPLMEEGKLPGLARMREEGSCGRFKTNIPTLSPSLWTTIATGASPEVHGVRNFYVTALPLLSSPVRIFPSGFGLNFRIIPFLNNSGIVPSLIRMNTSNMKLKPDIWDIFSMYGRTVGVIDYFVTWPADEVNGFVLSDLLLRSVMEFGAARGTRSEGVLFPPDIAPEVIEQIGDIHLEDFDMEALKGTLLPSECDVDPNSRYIDLIRKKLWRDECLWALSSGLYRSHRPDLLVNFTSAIDGTNHIFRHFVYSEQGEGPQWNCFHDLLEQWYRYEDARVAEMLELAGDSTCVIVLSDHGWDEEKGHHENGPDGALLMWGAGVKRGVWLEDAHLADVVPTVLAMAGYPVARDLEGRVLRDAILDSFLARYPVRFVETYGEVDVSGQEPAKMDPALDRQIREELEALGYIK